MVLDPAAVDAWCAPSATTDGASWPNWWPPSSPSRPPAWPPWHGAVATGDGAGLHRAAHSLKAGAATLGATDLAAVCSAVEALAEAGDLAAAADLVPAVESEYDRARDALEAGWPGA